MLRLTMQIIRRQFDLFQTGAKASPVYVMYSLSKMCGLWFLFSIGPEISLILHGCLFDLPQGFFINKIVDVS